MRAICAAAAEDVKLFERRRAAHREARTAYWRVVDAFDGQAVRDRLRVDDLARHIRQRRADGVAAIGRHEEDDASAAAGAADFSGPGAGANRGGDGRLDLRRGDAVDERLAVLPFVVEGDAGRFHVAALERLLHLDRTLGDLVEALV